MSSASFLLKASVAVGALLALGGGATAQDAGVETVVVTGTRIPRPEVELPTPVQTVSGTDISNVGTTNLTDYLTQLPSLVASLTQYDTSGYNTPASDDGYSLAGLNLLDLRNLGYVRTLVLVDAHRQVASSMGSAAIDVNTIPISLIDRVDITTGGASAIYGADGVSGVVNFVMKHDLEGLRASAQGGLSEGGGVNTFSAAVSYGLNTDDGRGNIAVALEYSAQSRLNYTQRDFSKVGGFWTFARNPYGTQYKYIPTNQMTYIWSGVHGAIVSDPYTMGYPDFTGDGQPFDIGDTYNGVTSIGGSGQPAANVLQGDLLPSTERFIGYISGRYDFSRYARLTADFKYVHGYADSFSTPPFDDYVVISADNAFLPANVAAAIAGGWAGYGLLGEDYLSLRREETVYRNTYQGTADLTGDITPDGSFVKDLIYDLSLSWGRTDVDDVEPNNRIEDRFFAALDSVKDGSGNPTCRSNLDPSAVPPTLLDLFGVDWFSDTTPFDTANYPMTFTPGSGCVAFNPFDPNPANQKEALAWITRPTHILGHIYQTVISGSITGKFPQTEAIFAGPLSLVLGGEYRFEKSQAFGDPAGRDGMTFDHSPDDVVGSFSVAEAFTEAELPLIKDVELIKELSINAAARYSSYSTAGSTTTWSFGGVWAPFESFRFRATDAYAVRAPNIGEMFAPGQTLYSSVNDPCDAANVAAGSSYRQANCVALMSALGVPYTPGVTDLFTGSTTRTIVSGNDQLKPESARTITAGFVLQPSELKELAITVDWWRVVITNAITTPSAQSIAEECVDLSSISNPYCDLVMRYGAGGTYPGSISQVSVKQINVASYKTSGIDFTVNYSLNTQQYFDVDYGTFITRINGGILDTLLYTALTGEAAVASVGEAYAPKYQTSFSLTWNYDEWDVNYNIDWYSSTWRLSRETRAGDPHYMDPKYWKYPERFLNNLQIGFTPNDAYRFYFGVNNLFNQKPGFASRGYPVGPEGRAFYFGLRLKTDGGLPGLPW